MLQQFLHCHKYTGELENWKDSLRWSSDFLKLFIFHYELLQDIKYSFLWYTGPSQVAQLVKKKSACNPGNPSLIPGSERSAGEWIGYALQYSWASSVAQLVRIWLQFGRPGFNPWVGKMPWRRERPLTLVFWLGEFHGLYSPWVRKELGMTILHRDKGPCCLSILHIIVGIC